MRILGCFIALLIFSTGTAWAGAPNFHCTDHHARIVSWEENNDQRKIVVADYEVNGAPVIRYNSKAIADSGLSPDALEFIYLQTCARLVLGHEFQHGDSVAVFYEHIDHSDCWAGNKFYYRGELDKLKAVEEEINALELSAWNSIPGPARKLNLESICRFTAPVWPK